MISSIHCSLSHFAVRRGGLATRWRRLLTLHRDQSGTISILTVFAVLMLTMIMGMVMNVGRQVDRKVRMQNAADAAAYSGGVTIARGMNALTFMNHLLCDVFALTAYLREGRDRDAESFVPGILQAWRKAGKTLSTSGFAKFDALGSAILERAREDGIEYNAVKAFGDMTKASSDVILPTLEQILQQELIPKFQRSLVEFMPQVATLAAQQVALQHGQTDPDLDTKLQAMLWRTDAQPVGTNDGFSASVDMRTLPVVDPSIDNAGGTYKNDATQQRQNLAKNFYLKQLNNTAMASFDDTNQPSFLSRFSYLWRGFTCGKLNDLLNEYPDTNLPFQIRTPYDQITNSTLHLEQKFTFVAVVYRPIVPHLLPGLFKNPLAGDTLAFAESRVFIPTRRLIKYPESGGGGGGGSGAGGGGNSGSSNNAPTSYVPGLEGLPLTGNSTPPSSPPSNPQTASPPPSFDVIRQGQSPYWYVNQILYGGRAVPTDWTLLNQNWTAQLVPANTDGLAQILQTNPPSLSGVKLPQLGGLQTPDLRRINTH
jgi:hypothetical protein